MSNFKKIIVEYWLSEEEFAQLERITALYNNVVSIKSTPEQLFESLMFTGSALEITEKLNFFEKNFTASQPQTHTEETA